MLAAQCSCCLQLRVLVLLDLVDPNLQHQSQGFQTSAAPDPVMIQTASAAALSVTPISSLQRRCSCSFVLCYAASMLSTSLVKPTLVLQGFSYCALSSYWHPASHGRPIFPVHYSMCSQPAAWFHLACCPIGELQRRSCSCSSHQCQSTSSCFMLSNLLRQLPALLHAEVSGENQQHTLAGVH